MMILTHEETKRQIAEQDPPIEVDQYWVAKNADGEVIRKIRVLAKHPDGENNWIYTDLPSRLIKHDLGRMGIFPEYNLRRIFELEDDTDYENRHGYNEVGDY